MDFGSTFKKIRLDHNMSQDDVANKLYVSRQAISNWENNKNLPDIEMLMSISCLFNVSLDQLILNQENMTKKLIKDTSKNTRAKYNLITMLIAAGLMGLGALLIIIKAFSVEYIDEAGILHENFFLLPIGFGFIFIGLIVMIVALLCKLANKKSN